MSGWTLWPKEGPGLGNQGAGPPGPPHPRDAVRQLPSLADGIRVLFPWVRRE